MNVLKNRIVFSLIVIFCLAFIWEFWVRPSTSPLYTEAVARFRDGNYERSLQLLHAAYQIDPNDAAVLSLLGWNYLKLDDPPRAELYFRRAHTLAPHGLDLLLGYAYTEIALKKFDDAEGCLKILKEHGVNTVDVHLAWATLYRGMGRNRDSVREFQRTLAIDQHNQLAVKNLREILNTTGDLNQVSMNFQPLARPQQLTFTTRVNGDHFDWLMRGNWQPAYLAGVDLTAVLPGHFPADSVTDSAVYDDWLNQISEMGANTIRVFTILPAPFYRSLVQFNNKPGRPALRLLQGIAFDNSPPDDLFDHDYYARCRKEIRETIDVIHGQADLGDTPTHKGGVYTDDVAAWVTGFLVGQAWPSHIVTANNQTHSTMQTYQGKYVEAHSGSATEIFLAQMIDYAAEYEENRYNWQRPIAFVNSPTLDPMRHLSESTVYEEVSLRRARGEHFGMPVGPYDDDDSVTVDPLHLHALSGFPAGYFASYSVFPYYPDFISREAKYREARDAEGSSPFLGYIQDLKAHHRGIPLVISEYGVPTSLGIGHFGAAGFDQGGETEEQQGHALSRMTRNIFDAGAAGGMVFEWVDQWFRQTWITRNFEVPDDRKPLWTSSMDPAESFGVLAAEPHLSPIHLLDGDLSEWANTPPIYSEAHPALVQEVGDRFDPARHLKALYADADESFLYLRLAVDKLDNDGDGQPDWAEVNYLIGISTAPGKAGLTSLPFIAPLRFPMGMTYAIELKGREFSRIWVASSYNPYRITPIDGMPGQTALTLKLGWQAGITGDGSFESQVIEPNRRRFGRNGEYFPPQRYDRGILRYGSLNPQSPDYDSLAEWHANVETNTIDLRIPWNLLNVTDPSSFKVLAGIDREGTVTTTDTPGFQMAVFSYRPMEISRTHTAIEQSQPVTDALPGMMGETSILAEGYKFYRWKGWDSPQYILRPKESYAMLRKAFRALPAARAPDEQSSPKLAQNFHVAHAQAVSSSQPQSVRNNEHRQESQAPPFKSGGEK